jgi:V8-like Glu-specific endopeptidase
MKIKSILLITQLLGLSAQALAEPASGLDEVIYGKDNRQEITSVESEFIKQAAKTVAGKILFSSLTPSLTNDSAFDFAHETLATNDQVCEDEPFAKQFVLSSCSAFLLGPDLLVTAGHCMENWLDCRTSAWIFDYTQGTNEIHRKDVYRCREIVVRALTKNRKTMSDYAVIRLDRKVEADRKPVRYRTDKKRVKLSTPLSVIGHPMGLPMKYADGAKVKGWNWIDLILPVRGIRHRKFYFTTNLDTFAGNSGSPVFNMKDKQIEGILVEGADDLKRSPDGRLCYVSRKRSSNSFFARETVFRINQIPDLNKLVEDSFERTK